ncbi:hypothetical protein C7476_1447 [Phyllobacterium bourgognense]|uniref:Uncharacterized protein n=1 Tax=Phyllobacterium bourgognense TaxID=314236 RepID=A0A368YBL3_9HYPH|nr:hypothetical protein C7476_1447 [Phyllobacterium bourgognense]
MGNDDFLPPEFGESPTYSPQNAIVSHVISNAHTSYQFLSRNSILIMTTLRPLKICIYGAGAVGGTIGVLLAQSRHDRLFVQCVY